MSPLPTKLRSLPPAALANLRRGIEKESLRVRLDGKLATTPHPRALGAALTHPHITTDFSESQLEFITGVHTTAASCLDELATIHRFVHRHLDDEMLWCGSMPCGLPDEDAIPIARYGRSNQGRAKTLYRLGLSHRYGRRMQVISGIHYNFSLAEESWPSVGFRDVNETYFALIRNFRRQAWLLLYLFGASPAVCSTFVEGRAHELRELAPGTLYLPHATSLRMGRLGYMSAAQDAISVSYNDLPSYVASLEDALTTPYPPYVEIGVGSGDDDGDDYRQLATTLLQIENEFYSTIRPKRVVRPDERPLHALRERGVQYVEVRAMDLDPFSAMGITAETVRFLDIFLLHCLLGDSPPDTPAEIATIGRNMQRVAARGREPGLCLERGGGETPLGEWSMQLLRECEPIAAALDAANGDSGHRDALAAAYRGVADPESLPSARALTSMRQHHGGSYFRFALAHSLEHRNVIRAAPLSADQESAFRRMADDSIALQATIEANDTVPFETYRQQYLSPDSLRVR